MRELLCDECHRVVVRAQLAGKVADGSTGPAFSSGVGILGGHTAFGVGYGGSDTRVRPETEREIKIVIFERGQSKEKDIPAPLRTISVRSLGEENSVSAVAREMCLAAFRDYPSNIAGKTYAIKPGEKPKE